MGSGYPRSARLTRPAEYARVFAGARRVADYYFTVLVIHNDYGRARLGVAVSKKTAPSAVVRNRIKRRIRETFRLHQTAVGGNDLVVIAKPPARAARGATLNTSLDRLWQRVSQRCERS
ncbi:MAG: ribonuclease P protein component [Nitrococcus mobilis]|nr:ribonuclease P protein component [Nitrococcus mobilis]